MFSVGQEDSYSGLKEVKAGVLQGIVLGPLLYLLYTYDIPELETNPIATFAEGRLCHYGMLGNIQAYSRKCEKIAKRCEYSL